MAILDDRHTAAISEQLRATLGFLERLTLTPGEIAPGDVALLRAAGVSDQAIEDAIQVCVLFSKMLAHKPEILRAFSQLYAALWADSALPITLKELAHLRVSIVNGCVLNA